MAMPNLHSQPIITMGKLWYLAIKHDMTLNGNPLKIYYNDNDDVAVLKKKVKVKKKISLPAN